LQHRKDLLFEKFSKFSNIQVKINSGGKVGRTIYLQGKISNSNELCLKIFLTLNIGHFQEPYCIFQAATSRISMKQLMEYQTSFIAKTQTYLKLLPVLCWFGFFVVVFGLGSFFFPFTWDISICLLFTGSQKKKKKKSFVFSLIHNTEQKQ